MTALMDRMILSVMIALHALREEEKGAVDLVTIVVLIGIAMMLAFFFRSQIKEVLDTMFSGIKGEAGNITQPVG